LNVKPNITSLKTTIAYKFPAAITLFQSYIFPLQKICWCWNVVANQRK